ncbi:hypothetical protein [Streptomyces sp. enrichment culture]|uniref:hypothetical protein n=1 Tax=Streptomyces sp. enrichment culture TaxID=1795815 RepID=UPI003F57B1DB
MVDDALAWSGLLLGVIGLAATVYQTVKLSQVRRRRQENLLTILNRTNFIKLDHEIVNDLCNRHGDVVMARYLWQVVQSSVELYMRVVDEYLAGEERFSFDDLDRMVGGPLISRAWQYRYWADQIARRPENRSVPVPEAPPVPGMSRVERYFHLRGEAVPPSFPGL